MFSYKFSTIEENSFKTQNILSIETLRKVAIRSTKWQLRTMLREERHFFPIFIFTDSAQKVIFSWCKLKLLFVKWRRVVFFTILV